MAETDIELSVKLDTKNISSSARDLRKEIKSMFDASEGMEMNTQLQRTLATLAKLSSQSRDVAKQMQAMANVKMPTQEYKDTLNRIELLDKALEKARDTYSKLAKDDNTPKAKMNDARDAVFYYQHAVEDAQKDLEKLVSTGNAFTLGSSSEEYQKLVNKSRDLYNQMVVTTNKAYELEPALGRMEEPLEEAKTLTERVAEGLTNFGDKAKDSFSKVGSVLNSLFRTAQRGFKMLIKHMNNTTKSSKHMHTSFKRILGYAIGIRSLYSLFSKLRRAVSDGIKNLAQWNNGNNKTNEALSTLLSSLTQLKNAIGSAFGPLISLAAPALNTIINLCISAANAIGMLIAKLGGSTTFVKATKVQKDFAKSLKGTGGAAKSAANELAAFDDLDVLNKGSGGGGGSDVGGMFEEVPIEMESMIDSLKDFLKGIDWESIKQKAEELGRHFADILNSVFADEELAMLLGYTIGEMINTAIHFAYGFVDQLQWVQMGRWFGTLIQTGIETVEWELMGETIGKLVNGIADSVIGFFERYQVGTLGDAIARMFNRAIAEINPTKIGTAIGDLIGAPIAEFTKFMKEADIQSATAKAFQMFKTILTGKLFGGDKTLGNIIGEGLAAVVNAGIDVLLGADTKGALDAIGNFLGDIFESAIDGITWNRVLLAFQTLANDITTFLVQSMTDIWYDTGVWLNEKLAEWIPTYDAESRIQELTETYNSVSEEIQATYERTDVYLQNWYAQREGERIADKEGIEDWEAAYQKSLLESKQSAQDASDGISKANESVKKSQEATKTSAEDMANAVSSGYSKMSTNAKTSTDEISTYIDVSKSKFDEGTEKAKSYETSTVPAIQHVGEVADTTNSSVTALDETIGTELDKATKTVDEWYTGLMTEYFSYEKWSTVFTDGMIAALTEQLDVFKSYWTDAMTLWMSDNDKKYWNKTIWQDKWDIITDTYETMWATFSETWKTNITNWMTNDVEPYFTKERWTTFGTHMQDGIFDGFKGIVSGVGSILTAVMQVFNSAMQSCVDSMNDMIDSYNDLAAATGGPSLSHATWNSLPALKIPALAQGAVIPPNKEFLAVLGDQRSGMNIEAPLETIKEAFRDVVANMEVQNTGYSEMTLDGETFARLLVPYMISELNREGYNVSVLEN